MSKEAKKIERTLREIVRFHMSEFREELITGGYRWHALSDEIAEWMENEVFDHFDTPEEKRESIVADVARRATNALMAYGNGCRDAAKEAFSAL